MVGSQNLEGIAKFRSWAEPLLSAYPSLEIRSLAGLKEGVWYNLQTTLSLSPAELEKTEAVELPAHPSFRIWREVRPSKAIREILLRLPEEVFVQAGTPIRLSTPPGNPPGPPAPPVGQLFWHFSRGMGEPELWDGRADSAEATTKIILDAHSGEASGVVTREAWAELGSALLRLRPRWYGTPDLIRRFLRVEYGWTMNHNTNLHITLDFRAEMGWPLNRSPNRFVVPVTAPPRLRPAALRIAALLLRPSGEVVSREAPVARVRPAGREDGAPFSASLSTRGARSMTLHLLLNDEVVHKAAYDLWAPKSPNPRLAALRTVGDAVEQMDRALTGPQEKKPDPERLEALVATLLAVGGFTTFHTGSRAMKGGEAVDVIALHPTAPLGVCVECTLGPASNKEKIAKLEQRATAMREALPGVTVLAILVTGASESAKPDLEAARERGVAIVNRSQLLDLRKRIEWDPSPFAAAQWLLGGQRLRLKPGD